MAQAVTEQAASRVAGKIKEVAVGRRQAAVQELSKLTQFLTTMVTYPFLYIFATTGAGAEMVFAPEARSSLTDFPEGRAIAELEHWCSTPVHLGLLSELLDRTKDWARGVLLRTRHPWLVSLREALEAGVDFPPEESLPGIVARERRNRHTSITKLRGAVQGNIGFIARQMQGRYTLQRGRTFFEFLQIILSLFRTGTGLVATVLFLWATGLRIGGSLAGVLSGALAFTVVISVALSAVSFVLYLAASACDGAGVGLQYLGSFASVAEVGSARARKAAGARLSGMELVGPRTVPSQSFEDLEELFDEQLSSHLSMRSRPDISRLRERLVIKAYDLQLVDHNGEVIASSPQEVAEAMRSNGFFGYSSQRQRHAAAVLLLRLLAWKRVNTVVQERQALRYIFILGLPQAGKTTLFAHLAQLPRGYSAARESVPAEMRLVQGQASVYAVLVPGLHSRDPHVRSQARRVADLQHGVVTCLVFMVSVQDDPQQVGFDLLFQALAQGKRCLLCINKGSSLVTEQASPASGSAAAEGGKASESGRRQQLQAAAKHEGQSEGSHADGQSAGGLEVVKQRWETRLTEVLHAAGLEPSYVTVLVTELLEVPPPGVAGMEQIRGWLQQVFAQQQR